MEDGKFENKNGRIRLEPKLRGTRSNEQQQMHGKEDFEIKTFDLEKFVKKNALRLGVSIVIFALVFAIKSLPFSFAQRVTQGVRWAMSYQMDWEEDILEKRNVIPSINNQIGKFMGTEEVVVTGNNEEKYLAPVDGVVTSSFEESIHPVFNTKIDARGIEISGESSRNISTIEKGKVLQVQEGLYGGKKITIQHDDQTRSVYDGCYESSVQVEEEILQGSILGKTKAVGEGEASVFYFELWKGENAVNPLDYIALKVDIAS